MAGPSWLVDSRRIASKIKNASEQFDQSRVKWMSNPSKSCPNCNHVIDNSDVVHEWPGLPKGVKFDPSDQELIWHLLAKSGKGNAKPHPFIDEFIPTVDQEEGICYTHPKRLPGVKQDGSVSHFFHRTFRAYNTGTRKRRKILSSDSNPSSGDVRWHKTGKTKPVLIEGEHVGCKKIMVLYMSVNKGGKAEKTNWVMHQYHLGVGEDERDGEFVVSKLFYQQQAQKMGEKCEKDSMVMETSDVPSLEVEMVDVPNLYAEEQAGPEDLVEAQNTDFVSEPNIPHIPPIQVPDETKEGNPIPNPEPENLETEAGIQTEEPKNWNYESGFSQDLMDSQQNGNPETQIPETEAGIPTEEPKNWNYESGFSQDLMDSQQMAANISVLNEFLLESQSQGENQILETGLRENEIPKWNLVPCGGLLHYVDKPEELKKDLEACFEGEKLDEFRLSQLDCYKENGSQDSFLASLAGME